MIAVDDIKSVDENTDIKPIKVDKSLSLKVLTKKQKDKCIRNVLDTVINSHNLENSIGIQSDFNVAILFDDNPESILMAINSKVIQEINNYIEGVLNEPASNYNRSMILFESEIQKDKVFIRWSN